MKKRERTRSTLVADGQSAPNGFPLTEQETRLIQLQRNILNLILLPTLTQQENYISLKIM